jgi:Polyketide cyclase / dehydrase and lipid transport
MHATTPRSCCPPRRHVTASRRTAFHSYPAGYDRPLPFCRWGVPRQVILPSLPGQLSSPFRATDNAGSSGHTDEMDMLRQSGSIVIRRSPEELYDMVADVTRMGEWSPVCTACWWDEGDGPHVGARFTGRNERPERTWETRSEVVTADRGREFAWVVAEPPTRARWGYSFVAVDGGTEVTETWELPPEGSAFFEKMFGDDAAK